MNETLQHHHHIEERRSRQLRIVAGYALFGVFFGLCFPVVATLIESWLRFDRLTLSGLLQAQQSEPLLWMIDSAPFFLGLFSFCAGTRQARADRYARMLKSMMGEKTSDLARVRARLENIIDAMAEILVIMDRNGRITDVNVATVRTFGYEAPELVGQPAAMLFGQDKLDEVLVTTPEEVFDRGFLSDIEGEYRTRDGGMRHLMISVAYLWDDHNAIEGVICIGRDITERRRMELALRESEEKFRELVQGLNVIIMKADAEFRFTFLNQFGQDFFGYTEEEVLGKSIIGTITPAQESTGRRLSEMVQDMIEHPENHLNNENENVCRDGTCKWVLWKNQPIYDGEGELVEFMSTGYDVTTRREAEELIRRQKAELEEVHGQMTLELEQARLAQLAALPAQPPELAGIRLAVKYSPMAQIGGDFYDFYIDPQNQLSLLVGDVTGHGIPAALLSFMFLTSFKNFRLQHVQPDQIIAHANRFLSDKLPPGKYATVYYCTYDPVNRSLHYASAGHPPGFLLREGMDSPLALQTSGTVVGMFEEPVLPFESRSIELLPGDKVLIYTDGVLEIADAEDRMLDSNAFEEHVASLRALPIDKLLEEIYRFCTSYAGPNGFNDDVTMIGLEVM